MTHRWSTRQWKTEKYIVGDDATATAVKCTRFNQYQIVSIFFFFYFSSSLLVDAHISQLLSSSLMQHNLSWMRACARAHSLTRSLIHFANAVLVDETSLIMNFEIKLGWFVKKVKKTFIIELFSIFFFALQMLPKCECRRTLIFDSAVLLFCFLPHLQTASTFPKLPSHQTLLTSCITERDEWSWIGITV